MTSAIWLAATEAAATSTNLPNLLPSEERSRRRRDATNRGATSVMEVLAARKTEGSSSQVYSTGTERCWKWATSASRLGRHGADADI
jgi:hypothetical protein